jgi:SAM-dependent methyltransferase
MTASFDIAAPAYDQTFTHSVIGALQRQYVYKHLSGVLNERRPETILEINCGTGEDALWLANQNFSVTATDISEKMIAIGKEKGPSQNLHFQQADIKNLANQYNGYQFDLVFSNFGGLNCLSPAELAGFFKSASSLLTNKGRLVLVIMPKDTLWERLYFMAKGDFGNVSRRKRNQLSANVDGAQIPVYYYNPEEVRRLADEYFGVKNIFPVGFFVPPSYLESFFNTRPNLVSVLQKLENLITSRPFAAKYSDHYMIVLQKK